VSRSAVRSANQRASPSSGTPGQRARCACQRGVVAPVPPGRVEIGGQLRARFRFPCQRPQDVEADHVARAFPDAVQRRLPVEHRQGCVLHVAHAAEALHRLHDHAGGKLVVEVFRQRHGDPGEGRAGGIVEGPRDVEAERRRALPVEHQIGQKRPHQRLIDQPPLEGGAVRDPMAEVIERGAHQARRRTRGVETRVMHHRQDRRYTAPRLAHQMRQRAVILDLGRGIGAVPELVLQPHQVDGVARAVGQPAWDEEAGETGLGLRERQEPVGHGRGAEPLVPGQAPRLAVRFGPRAVRAHIRAALFLRHRHAERRGALHRHRGHGRVVIPRRQLRHPERGQVRRGGKRGDGGIGHRQGAAGAGLHLGMQVDHRGMLQVAAPGPGRGGVSRRKAQRHQPVIAVGEPHLVEPSPARVEGAQAPAGACWRPAPNPPPARCRARGRGPHIRAMGPQHRVIGPEVAVPPRGRLVRHLVSRQGSIWGPWHALPPPRIRVANHSVTGGFPFAPACANLPSEAPVRGARDMRQRRCSATYP
jgi:hypothetical protein